MLSAWTNSDAKRCLRSTGAPSGRSGRGRGRRNRLTTWVPLTDATLSNGCMYVVPKSTDERVQQAVENYSSRKMSMGDVQRLLQHARALPARAGSVLCWGFGLLHWGSVN